MTPILLSDINTKIAFLKESLRCEVTEERNGSFECTLTYPVAGRDFAEISIEKYIKVKPNPSAAPQLFKIYSVSKPISGSVTVNCEHISYALSRYPVKSLTKTKTTALAAISRVLSAVKEFVENGYAFSADYCDIDTVANFGAECCSARAALGGIDGSILDCYGGEYEFDNLKIKLHKARGKDNGVIIRYGKNMTEMKLTLSAENSYTGVFPYAIDNDKYIYLSEGTIHVENSSGIEERILSMDFSSYFDDSEEKNEDNLKNHVNKYLSDNDINAIDGSMTVSMIDLSKSAHAGIASSLEVVSLCDTVKVVNAPMGVTVKMKVVKTVYDAIGEKYTSLELGTPSSNFADVIKQTQRTANEALRKASETPDTSTLEQNFKLELDEMTKKITGASGGHVVLNPSQNPQELLILCDSDQIETATKLYRFNSAGLAYSPNGYDGPYTTAYLGDDGKLIINNITARSISASLIKSDTISSDSGDLLINLTGSQIISGATSPTRTTIEAGHLDLYYSNKYSGRIGQTSDNNIAIEGTNPSGGTSKSTNLEILDGSLYTNTNGRNLFAGLTHCRNTQYSGGAYNFPAYLKVGIGANSSSPTMSCELWLNSLSGNAVARIDILQKMYNTKHVVDSDGNKELTWSNYGDLDVIFSRDCNGSMKSKTLRITDTGYEFLSGPICASDIYLIADTDSKTGSTATWYSLRTILRELGSTIV